ncbi:MAG: ASCH domain-containing protein [Promethearchaeota archaeon]
MPDIIMSIKPRFAEMILQGTKTFELRKNKPRKKVDTVFIYSTSPVKKIVGKFKVVQIISGTPEEVWEKCKKLGGIERGAFFSYFKGCKIAHAFEIRDAKRFDPPINPFSNPEFKAPQNFAYWRADIK